MMNQRTTRTERAPAADDAYQAIEPSPSDDLRYDPAAASGSVGEGKRLLELDALRGLACLLILLHHIAPDRVPWGWVGVDLFFVLSGFLITSIIVKSYRERHFLANFAIRRGLRIWPIYYLTILLLVAAIPVLPSSYDLAGLPYLLTYTQNVPLYWSGKAPQFASYLMHTWSLAIEEQFYLIWPTLICIVGRRGVVPLSLALAFTSVWARGHGFHWWLLLARGDGLALGSLLAILLTARAGGIRRLAMLRWAFGMGAAVAALYLMAFSACAGIFARKMPLWPASTVLVVNLCGFGLVGLVVCLQGHRTLAPLRSRWLVKLGQLSYGLYIYHYVILLLSDDIARRLGLGGRPFWRQALTVAAIFALAGVSWRYIERPILRLKDRFGYGPAARPRAHGPHLVEISRAKLAGE